MKWGAIAGIFLALSVQAEEADYFCSWANPADFDRYEQKALGNFVANSISGAAGPSLQGAVTLNVSCGNGKFVHHTVGFAVCKDRNGVEPSTLGALACAPQAANLIDRCGLTGRCVPEATACANDESLRDLKTEVRIGSAEGNPPKGDRPENTSGSGG